MMQELLSQAAACAWCGCSMSTGETACGNCGEAPGPAQKASTQVTPTFKFGRTSNRISSDITRHEIDTYVGPNGEPSKR